MRRYLAILGWLLLTGGTFARSGSDSGSDLWDLRSLAETPKATWGAREGAVQEVYYAGEPFEGRPTRVFAYVGRPVMAESAPSRDLPAMVLVHGGGGKAFKNWAEQWAARGYVAIAMDLAGNGPAGRLEDGGPDQSDSMKFRNFTRAGAREMWSYHAVAAVIRGHSLLRSLPEVDPDRVGITGISWGGYLTCIVAGLDARLKVAVPVYGCGFLGDNSYWKDRSLAAMSEESRSLWLELFDPGQYLGNVRRPILFLNGTTDFAYPMDSYRKSYREVPSRRRTISVVVDLPHGHIFTFQEVDSFVDAALRNGEPLARIGPSRVRGGRVTASVTAKVPVREARLCYTLDSGPWEKRAWKTVPARLEGRTIRAELPSDRPLVGFLAVTDERGLRTSGEHFELGED